MRKWRTWTHVVAAPASIVPTILVHCGQSKVANAYRLALVVAQDVFWLEIAVADSPVVAPFDGIQ